MDMNVNFGPADSDPTVKKDRLDKQYPGRDLPNPTCKLMYNYCQNMWIAVFAKVIESLFEFLCAISLK